jgi:hypothetical protein
LYTAVLVRLVVPVKPPATSTLPSDSSVAVWKKRPWAMGAVVPQLGTASVEGSERSSPVRRVAAAGVWAPGEVSEVGRQARTVRASVATQALRSMSVSGDTG